MRKVSRSVLVLIATLAIFSSAVPVFAQSENPFMTHRAHPTFILRSSKGSLSPASGSYTPAQLRKAYGIDLLSQQGKGITIAILDACGNPTAQADLNTYDSTFGLPATTIKIVTPQGQPCSDQGWGLETDLDLQMAHAFAPKAKLVLEEAASPSFFDLDHAAKNAYNKHHATVISMSFIGGEFSGETGSLGDGIFSAGNAKGVSFTAASGDGGCGSGYPAASPFVTSVGGTSLYTQSDGTYISESAWGGSGGGPSVIESLPAYQNGFYGGPMRGIPDVAMVADPGTGVDVYDSGYGGWVVVGGTSVATPLWAGVLADANSGRTNTMKNADNELYAIASDPSKYAADYHDITTGSSGGVCNAGPGYDLVTGLGTPIANTLVPDLIAAP